MSTLMIKDLAIAEELDRSKMAAVHGGTGKGWPSYDWAAPVNLTQKDFSFNAEQMLSQCQETLVNNGNNVAFSSGITANVSPYQNGQNTINLG